MRKRVCKKLLIVIFLKVWLILIWYIQYHFETEGNKVQLMEFILRKEVKDIRVSMLYVLMHKNTMASAYLDDFAFAQLEPK